MFGSLDQLLAMLSAMAAAAALTTSPALLPYRGPARKWLAMAGGSADALRPDHPSPRAWVAMKGDSAKTGEDDVIQATAAELRRSYYVVDEGNEGSPYSGHSSLHAERATLLGMYSLPAGYSSPPSMSGIDWLPPSSSSRT